MVKNILLIIPNLTMGGAQKSFTALTEELSKEYRLYIVYFNKNDGLHYKPKGELISLDIPGGRNLFDKVFNFFKRISALKKIKKNKNITASISFLEGADYINILSGGSDKKILSIRGSKLADTTIKGIVGWIRKNILISWLYPLANHIVVVNEGIKDEMVNYFGVSPKNITIVHNYYQLNKIEKLASEPIHDRITSKPFIHSFGRIAPEKGYSYLLDIFYRILKSLPNYRLILIGEGPELPALILKCQKLNLSYSTEPNKTIETTQIIFTGIENNPFRYTSKSSLFIMTSDSEGFPNALAESMICGTPVISTDCPWGPREILAPGSKGLTKRAEYAPYGILMPVLKNQESILDYWSKTIIEVLKNKEILIEYSQKGKERMRAFSIDHMLQRWKKVIEEK